MIVNIISLIVSFIALITSTGIGIWQYKLNRKQFDWNNKVELYLQAQPIEIRSLADLQKSIIQPSIIIKNIGGKVVYLEKYIFNGREYPLAREVLPSVSDCDACHYIYLPTNGTNHVSIEVHFEDWEGRCWKTIGYADYQDGEWRLSYKPSERITSK